MREPERWKPTKVVRDSKSGRYVPNPPYVGTGSRFIASLQIEAYVRLIRAHASGRLIDCGCGAVPYYEIYREYVTDVTCIDWEHSAHGSEHVDEYVDLNGPLPFANDSFDTVLLTDVLNHIVAPGSLIRELARVLRPGGMVLAGTPFFYPLREQPHDYHRFTEFALRRLCTDSGLTVVELEAYGGYPDVLLDMLNKKLVGGESAVRVFLAFARTVTRLGPYRRLRARTKSEFPLGYCLAAQKPIAGDA